MDGIGFPESEWEKREVTCFLAAARLGNCHNSADVVYVCMHVCVCVCVCVFYLCVFICVHYVCAYVCMCMYAYVCVHVHECVCLCLVTALFLGSALCNLKWCQVPWADRVAGRRGSPRTLYYGLFVIQPMQRVFFNPTVARK